MGEFVVCSIVFLGEGVSNVVIGSVLCEDGLIGLKWWFGWGPHRPR